MSLYKEVSCLKDLISCLDAKTSVDIAFLSRRSGETLSTSILQPILKFIKHLLFNSNKRVPFSTESRKRVLFSMDSKKRVPNSSPNGEGREGYKPNSLILFSVGYNPKNLHISLGVSNTNLKGGYKKCLA